ncbi:MAG: hypothetical protein R3E87_09480 [Burkholderiaceae bacterium]
MAVSWLVAAAMVSGAGWAGTNSAAVNALISPWFERRRGLALSLALNGASAGGIILAPAWALAIEASDLTTAGVGMAILLAVLALPIARGAGATPAATGQWVDNEPPRMPDKVVVGGTGHPPVPLAAARSLPMSVRPSDPENVQGPAPPAALERDAGRAQAPASRSALMRDPPFRRVMLGFALALFAQVGLLTHLLARLLEAMPVAQAAAWVGAVSFSALVGRNLYGMAIGRLGARRVAVLGLSVQAAGVGLLSATDVASVLALGCLLFGAGVGNLITLPAILLQDDYRGRTLARAVALAVAVNQALFSLAPAAFGLMRDASGSYGIVFVLAAAMMAASAVMLARPVAAHRH